MPTYRYLCEANGQEIELQHSIKIKYETWGQLARAAAVPRGKTPEDTPVIRLIGTPVIQHTTGEAELKNMGMTKLVRRDKGVYENVTATGDEAKIVNADDISTYPKLNKKISD